MKISVYTTIVALCIIAPAVSGGTQPGDVVLPRCDPTPQPYTISGGNCGEACLWTILYRYGMNISQKDINRAGGSPGRGLYSHELIQVLRKYKVGFRNRSYRTSDYQGYILHDIIPSLRSGNPIILGVKVYPDNNPAWSCDHFILVAGYNLSSRELIINDVTKRDRISFEQLTSGATGYSIASSHQHVFAIEIKKLRPL
jgi:ABC-type bacteriocin/lantibiotic exporter with double-glycine peptidase domain